MKLKDGGKILPQGYKQLDDGHPPHQYLFDYSLNVLRDVNNLVKQILAFTFSANASSDMS